MKNATADWEGRAVSLPRKSAGPLTAAHLVGRTSTRFSLSAQGWSVATTLGYKSIRLKARCPAHAGRRESRSAGASASFPAPQFIFTNKNPSPTVRKTLKVNKGNLRVFGTPPGVARFIPHIHRPGNAKAFIFNHFLRFQPFNSGRFLPQKTRDL